MDFRGLFHHFKEMKHYLIAALLVFAAGLYLGWAQQEQFSFFLENQIKGIQPLTEFIQRKENPQLWFFLVILFNNVLKAILFIFMGLLLGIYPLFVLVGNGLLLGYVISLPTEEGVLYTIIRGILPHGIIEIPAIILACAYGMKLGMLVWKAGFQAVLPRAPKTARAELARVLKLTKPLVVLVSAALLLAAVIESTLTYWLLH